jgi:hypothetical protein
MVRKWAGRAIILYILYAAAMYWYIFYGADTTIPEALRGTDCGILFFSYRRHMNGFCISSYYYSVFQGHLKNRQWQSRDGKRSERAFTYSGFPLFHTWLYFQSVSLDIG